MSIVRVAERAGVSIATVSRVLNDAANVRAATAEQVMAAVQALNYVPPAVKRGPKGGARRALPAGMRSGNIAVLNLGGSADWLGMPVMASVVAGVMRAAKACDVGPVLDEMPDPHVLSPLLRRREVDGAIVFMPSGQAEGHLESLRAHTPAVWLMGGESGVPNVDHVTADNHGIGRLAFDYLARHGCRRLMFACDAPGLQIMRLRGQSFGNAARDAGLDLANVLCNAGPRGLAGYSGHVVDADSHEAMADAIVAHRPDGLFVCADRVTVRLYPLLIARGLVPERDVRLVSCDNEREPLSHLAPRPASIDLNSDELGAWAVRQLIHRIQHRDGPAARIQVAPRLALAD